MFLLHFPDEVGQLGELLVADLVRIEFAQKSHPDSVGEGVDGVLNDSREGEELGEECGLVSGNQEAQAVPILFDVLRMFG